MLRPLITALLLATAAPAAVLTEDVSGPAGQKDHDGRPDFSAGDTRGRGRAGDDGGHAREASTGGRLNKKGFEAGTLILNLSVEADTSIRVHGRKSPPEQSFRDVVIDRSIPLDASASLRFIARGGRGGDGGHGGRGQDGGRGHSGTDATAYSSGSDGGPGGRGGREGHSTDGGDAGRGGTITVRVPIADTDLAMLLDEVDVRGNAGGARGVSRGVGRGGAGGAGGSSYTWFETQYRPATRVSFDSEGNAHHETYMESHIVVHTNPGGWSGPRGHDGRASERHTRAGQSSADGQFRFEVEDERGRVVSYESPYDLRLLPGYTLTGSHNANGFFEPGETITLGGLRVINSGKSPTPRHQRVKLFMSDNAEYVRSNGEELTLPKVLEPGEEYQFPDTLRFHLAERSRDVAGRLRDLDVVAPRARVTRVEREFKGFAERAPVTIRVRYPIEITPLQTLITVAPGEATLASVRVKNISTQTIGKTADNPWLRAAAVKFLRTAGSTRSADFVMSFKPDRHGTSPELGLIEQLNGLAPGASKIVEMCIGFRPDAAHYTKVNIQPELFLESIIDRRRVKRVQFEPFELRVSRAYEYSPDADVLLVANHGLDAKVLDAFEATAALKQLKMDVWDFSRHGFFDLSHEIEDYGPMFEAYRGKTIVVLGNVARTPRGDVRAPALISPDRVIEAARRYGVKIVILDSSEDPAAGVAALTEPLPLKKAIDRPDADVREFVSNRQYLKEFAGAVHEVQEALGDVTSFLGISRVRVDHTPLWPWAEPKREHLVRAARRAQRGTESYAPESRVFIDYEFNPRVIGTRFWLWKRWTLGSISLRRSVDESKTSVVAIKLPPHRMEDPDFILGEEFQTAFDLALNFNTKLNIFNSIILGRYDPRRGEIKLPERFRHLRARAPMAYARTLTHTLLLDLLHEQITIRPRQIGSRVRERDLWDKLDLLKKLTHHDYTQFKLSPDSEEGRLFVDLVASMRFFNHAITTAWQRWFSLDLSKNLQASYVTKQMLDRLVNAVFADVPAARAVIEARVKELRARAREQNVSRDQLVGFLDRGGLSGAVVRDGQVHRDPAVRVRDPGRARHLRDAEARRRREARAVRREVEADTKRLRLTPEDCARLLAGSGDWSDGLPRTAAQ